MRKAYYSLNLGLRSNEESSALAFGSAIHKALERWYQLPTEERVLPKSLEEQAELMGFAQGMDTVQTHGALEAIRQFVLCRFDILSALPEGDKRSLASGIRILKAYFKHYANDGFVILTDKFGLPLVERTAEHVMYDSDTLQIIYFGTVDCILQNTATGVIVVADHKTTSALGSEFYNRCKPNPQYTGYVWLAKHALGIDTSMFMINGIQTAKTKTEFARQITDRGEDDFFELESSVINAVKNWTGRQDSDADYRNRFPMTAPQPCAEYGGCQYRKVCELPESMKAQVIKMEYGK